MIFILIKRLCYYNQINPTFIYWDCYFKDFYSRFDFMFLLDPYPTFASSMTLAEDIKTAHKDCWAVNNYHNLIKTGERIHQVLPQVEEILRYGHV